MIIFSNIVPPSAEQMERVVMGTRNPMDSWSRSDSICDGNNFVLGENDKALLTMLNKEGAPNRKFLRMMHFFVDISAPLYWWKEFDTYKIGVNCNSCSTMHKITAYPFTIDMFSHDALDEEATSNLEALINGLNLYRIRALDAKKEGNQKKFKKYWRILIQLLPSSFLQKRTVEVSYEVAKNQYFWRKNHKLSEWVEYCKMLETLPYAHLFIVDGENNGTDKV